MSGGGRSGRTTAATIRATTSPTACDSATTANAAARRLASPPRKSATPHESPETRPSTTAPKRYPRSCGWVRSSSGPFGTIRVGLMESCVT